MIGMESFLSNALGMEIVDVDITVRGVDISSVQPTLIVQKPDLAGHPMIIRMTYGKVFEEDLFFRTDDNAVTCERRIRNVSAETQKLEAAVFTLRFRPFGQSADDYFYHVENPRLYNRYAIRVDCKRGASMVSGTEFDAIAGNRWIDPHDADERIAYAPYQSFPAILLSNYKSNSGLVHGTLSQRIFFHYYTVKHEDGLLRLDVMSGFKAIDYREIRPGEVIEDRWYLGVTTEAGDIERLFADYIRVLKKHLPPLYGATTINRHSVVWGSWNDGIFRNIDEKSLLSMADFIATELPTVKWLQVDDGYATHAGRLAISHGLGAPYEANGGTDMAKFPDNLRSFTEKTRACNVEPAIWIGGHVPADTPLGREKPEWFFDYSIRIGPELRFLDISNPEVRDYMVRALDFFFGESGFRGMKHDFWSYAFEDSRVRLARREKSGYEWRTWWLQEIRKRLPEYAYLQTGCDIVMANPFLAEYFTNYRYGIDIGAGNWDQLSTTFLWGSACFALHIGDLFVPNSDAIGILPGLSDREALFCINFCLISRSMVEVGGWLYKEAKHPRMKWVRKALCCPNNGQDVFFVGFDYRNEHSVAPAVWYLRTPHFSHLERNVHLPQRTVAIFNINDKEETFRFNVAQMDIPAGRYLVTNIWTGEVQRIDDIIEMRLEERSSVLLSLNVESPTQILDANMKIDDVHETPVGLRFTLEYPGDLELLLSFRPSGLECDDRVIALTVEPQGEFWRASCTIPKAGVMTMRRLG
jgi:hypothetical protein